jgi:hypothetical protein
LDVQWADWQVGVYQKGMSSEIERIAAPAHLPLAFGKRCGSHLEFFAAVPFNLSFVGSSPALADDPATVICKLNWPKWLCRKPSAGDTRTIKFFQSTRENPPGVFYGHLNMAFG